MACAGPKLLAETPEERGAADAAAGERCEQEVQAQARQASAGPAASGPAPLFGGEPEGCEVLQITREVGRAQTGAVFEVEGGDKSWFLQRGGLLLARRGPEARFLLRVTFLGGARNRYGDAYAALSLAEQRATRNWLLMLGAAPRGRELTGHRDCKAGGFYFLLHLDRRRAAWRVVACPHEAELEDAAGRLYACDPRGADRLEVPAREGQVLGVEYAEGALWLLEGGARAARGHWAHGDGAAGEGGLPRGEYLPAVLFPNCPTSLRAEVE